RPGGHTRGGAVAMSDRTPVVRTRIQSSAYYDSVTLMQLQRQLLALPGVEEAGAVMGTDANKELLRLAGLLSPEAAAARPDDLVVAVRGSDAVLLDSALAQVETLLHRRRESAGGEAPLPRTLASARAVLPDANLALISVPGRYARLVAEEALRAGLHVFCFSDNVPLADEVALKGLAAEHGLLFMGPDCGTALIGGAALGFANAVRRGTVGIVAASGTGLQGVASRLERLGAGVSHAIGTGGRDLREEVAGATFLAALRVLAADAGTRVIVAVSKPPAPAVRQRVLATAAATGKPVVVHFVGEDRGGPLAAGVYAAPTLAAAADLAVALAGSAPAAPAGSGPEDLLAEARAAAARLRPGQVAVRGLYSGGTLCYEAQAILRRFVDELAANEPLPGVARHAPDRPARGHVLLDLGADEFTVGRLHPMLDMESRIRRLAREAEDAEVAVILLDVVLGFGAHPDPAGELAPAIASARERAARQGRELVVVAAICGTAGDPQGLGDQCRRLAEAGARVTTSHAEAAALAGAIAALAGGRPVQADDIARALGTPAAGVPLPAGEEPQATEDAAPAQAGPVPEPIRRLLDGGVAALNFGVPAFADSLRQQGVPVVHVDWRPPAGGNARLLEALRKLKS
ncbi:MAG TPA: acyl-CoA synthetase FdrA, partial [Thermaerobacter sp.]